VITLRVQNRCSGSAVDKMNLYNQREREREREREICVRNFMISNHKNIIVCKSVLTKSCASKCE